MNWDAVGAIAEMIGGIAVLVTLIYLAIQVRHASRIQRQTLLSNQTAHWVSNCQTIAAHPEQVIGVFSNRLEGPGSWSTLWGKGQYPL